MNDPECFVQKIEPPIIRDPRSSRTGMIRLIERALEVNGGSAAAFPLSVVSAARPNLNLEIGVRRLASVDSSWPNRSR